MIIIFNLKKLLLLSSVAFSLACMQTTLIKIWNH